MKKIAIGAVLVVLAMLAVFVWPTVYRYDDAMIAGAHVSVRTNRINGEMERLESFGWYNPSARLQSDAHKTPCPPATANDPYRDIVC